MNTPEILDTTLRDGSYAINFQFSAADTSQICSELEKAGIRWIEIGHGVGLGGSELGFGEAAETDKAYMQAAASSVREAKWGMFCIPGIATVDMIDMAADQGMGFIRIGTDVQKVDESRPFIERAHHHGLTVMANFMKSYTTPPDEFAQQVLRSQEFGAEIVYIVDSAGGMLLSEIEDYFNAVRSVCDVPIGFHGHNNLGLAVATAFKATELGAALIDCSLQGLGRSSGNTPTEQFVAVLERAGIEHTLDIFGLLDAGENLIRPLLSARGCPSIDVVSGYSLFHSSYMKTIRKYSSQYRIDPRRLIVAVCDKDKVNAHPELVEQEARKLSTEPDMSQTARFHFERYHGSEQ